MDLYRTLDLKFNLVDSSQFESNFKRTINCPTTRANMNEPSKRMTYWRYSGDSRMKKMGSTAGPRKKVGGQHKCLSCMVIFRCNEDWFAMIKPIKPNIGLWISSEPSPESLQIVWNFAGWKLSAVYASETSLKMKLSKKLGEPSRGPAKNLGGAMANPAPSLRTPLWRYHCTVTYVTRQWRSYHTNFSFIVT